MFSGSCNILFFPSTLLCFVFSKWWKVRNRTFKSWVQKELYLLDEPRTLSLLVNIEKADYQVIQSVKFSHLHQSTFEPHFFFLILNIPSWLEGIIGYPNCKWSPGITVRMQVLETRQESCFKDGKGWGIERPGFPCLRSWETLEDEGEYVTRREMWTAYADLDPQGSLPGTDLFLVGQPLLQMPNNTG